MVESSSIKIVTGSCPFNEGNLAFQDSAPVHQCIFHSDNLHVVNSREEALQLVASVEKGCGSCSNVILHEIEGHVEVIWSGCGNVKGPIIDKALQGLAAEKSDLLTEAEGSAHVITVANTTLSDVRNRFETVYLT